jgi:hypothetical protein
MRKSDLTQEQAAERAGFVRKLQAFGWDPGGWEILFEGGADLLPEAQAEYRNDVSVLRLGLDVSNRQLRLECLPTEEGEELSLLLCPRVTVEEVLDPIVAKQDQLSARIAAALIKELTPLCWEAYLETARHRISLK